MILSMTGFASVAREFAYGTLHMELRSVNHRYLEIQFRLPEELRTLETVLREAITAQLSRGKLECRLAYTPLPAERRPPAFNSAALQQLLALEQQVRRVAPQAALLSTADILRWPGIFAEQDEPLELMSQDAQALLTQALAELTATRAREGDKLKAVMLERVQRMEELAAQAAPRIPELVAQFSEKLAQRLAEVLEKPDDDRLRQEAVMFAAKIDVDEELSRLRTHLAEVRRVLEKGGVVGKRLDFLMQELNRESNTLGAKSVAYDVSKISVELKILIEQLREQVQNIE